MRPASSTLSLPVPGLEELPRHLHREAAHTAEESVEPRHVHPDSLELYHTCGGKLAWTRYVPIFGRAVECYGPKFVFTLDFTEFMSKGITYYILQNAAQPMFVNRYKCSAMEFQRYNNVGTMGWAIKPFTALISDSFPLFHYTKRWYLVLSCAIGGIASILYGVLPPVHESASTAAALLFLAGYGMANLDILSEGLYSRLIRRHPAAGPSLVSSLWWILSVAGIISALIQGPLSDGGMEQVGAYIGGASMIVIVPIFALNWFGELTNREERLADYAIEKERLRATSSSVTSAKQHPLQDSNGTYQDGRLLERQPDSLGDEIEGAAEDLNDADLEIPSFCGGLIEVNKSVLVTNFRLTLYAIIMTCGVMANVIVTMVGGRWPLLITCSIVVVVLVALSFWSLPSIVAKANLFAFLNQALYVALYGPIQTFFVASAEDFPGGPNFSYFFYNTVSAALGNAAAVVGVSMFPYLFAKRSFRLTFIVTSILMVVGSIFDLIIVKRWNLKVGIPDHYTYVFGDAIAFQVAYMLNWMPMIVLLAQLCPRGAESTVYALLAGFSNLGQTIAAQIGTLLMDFALPVDTTTAPFDFSNLPWLIVIGHLLMPLLQIPCAMVLIPKSRICDPIIHDEDKKVVAAESSDAPSSQDS